MNEIHKLLLLYNNTHVFEKNSIFTCNDYYESSALMSNLQNHIHWFDLS